MQPLLVHELLNQINYLPLLEFMQTTRQLSTPKSKCTECSYLNKFATLYAETSKVMHNLLFRIAC